MIRAKKKYNGNRKLLLRLFKDYNGRCYYCGRATVLPVSGYSGTQPLNLATIEHIYSKFSLIRYIVGEWDFVTLACWQCNNRRGNKEASTHKEGYNYKEDHEGLLFSLLNNANETIQ